MADNFGLKIGVEGEKEFKSALRDINQSFKVLGSEMNLVSASFGKNDKSVQALTARNSVLGKEIDAQKEKISTLKDALANAAESFGENDKRTQAWTVQLNNARADLIGLEKELDENSKALDESADGFEDAEKGAEDFGEAIKKSGRDAEESGGSFSKLGGILKTTCKAVIGTAAAIGGAAAVAGAGMFKMADSAANTGKEVNNMSQKLGLSREGFQEWQYILKKSGTSIDVMGIGMKTLQKTMGGMTEDGDSASKAFAAVGLSFDEVKGKTPEEALNMTVKALQDMPAGADKTAAALKLFGKGAMELQPLLNKASADTDELRQRAHDMGLVLSDEQIDNSVKFKSAMGRIKDTMEGIKLQLGSSIVPAFADGLGAFLDFANGAEGGEEKMKSAIDNIIAALSDTFPALITRGSQIALALVSGLSSALPGLAAALSSALPQLIAAIASVLPEIALSVMQAVPLIAEALLSALPALADAGVQVIIALAAGISGMLPALIPVAVEALMTITSGLLGNIPLIISAAAQLAAGLADGIIGALPVIAAALPEVIDGIITAILGSIPLIIGAGIDLLTSLVDALPEIITAIVEAIPQIIDGIITAVIDSVPLIIRAGIDLIVSLVQALPTIITTIVAAIPKIVSGLTGAITGNIDKIIVAGVTLLVALVKNTPKIITEVVKAVPLIVSGIVKAITELVPKLAEAGLNLIKGLWKGMSDAGAWLWDKIKSLFSGIMDKVKGFFGIKSPSTVMADIGENLSKGLAKGIGSKEKEVQAAMKKLTTGTAKVTKAAFTELSKELKKINDTHAKNLSSLQKESAKKHEEIRKEYEKTIDDIGKKQKQLAAGISGFSGLFAAPSINDAVHTDSLVRNAEMQTKQVQDFYDVIEKLKKRNIPQEIIDQFVDMGPGAALQLQQFAAMTDMQLAEYLSLYEKRQKLASNLASKQYADERADAAAARDIAYKEAKADLENAIAEENARYNLEMAAFTKTVDKKMQEVGKALKDGLKKGAKMSKSEASKVAANLTKGIVTQVKKELGIKSPSRVFAGIGEFMAAGIGVGFEREMKKVEENLKDAIPKEIDTDTVARQMNRAGLLTRTEGQDGGRGAFQVIQNFYTEAGDYAKQQRAAARELRQVARALA
jgi:phage-related protein